MESREAVDLVLGYQSPTCNPRPGFGSACLCRVGHTVPGRGAREIKKIYKNA